jgi:hypothetical protein
MSDGAEAFVEPSAEYFALEIALEDVSKWLTL